MRELLQIKPLPGYEPEIGRRLWALEEVRHRTLRLVEGLDQRTLDWEGADGRENAIGSLLYHIAIVEMGWLFVDTLQQELPPAVRGDFPYGQEDADGRLTRVRAVPLNEHLAASRRGWLRSDASRHGSPRSRSRCTGVRRDGIPGRRRRWSCSLGQSKGAPR